MKELIQNDFTVENITEELKRLLYDEPYRREMISEYETLLQQLGGPGASARIAKHLVEDAKTIQA